MERTRVSPGLLAPGGGSTGLSLQVVFPLRFQRLEMPFKSCLGIKSNHPLSSRAKKISLSCLMLVFYAVINDSLQRQREVIENVVNVCGGVKIWEEGNRKFEC